MSCKVRNGTRSSGILTPNVSSILNATMRTESESTPSSSSGRPGARSSSFRSASAAINCCTVVRVSTTLCYSRRLIRRVPGSPARLGSTCGFPDSVAKEADRFVRNDLLLVVESHHMVTVMQQHEMHILGSDFLQDELGALEAGYVVFLCVDHQRRRVDARYRSPERKSTRLNSSHQIISYAVFCLKKTIVR